MLTLVSVDRTRRYLVAKARRNEPCACGSGRKSKRCCAAPPGGPTPQEKAVAWLATQARAWAPLLAGYTTAELDEVRGEVCQLPRLDVCLHAPLPRVLPPPLERLRRAIRAGDREGVVTEDAGEALDAIDTPLLRAHLGRGVVELHDDGHHIACEVAAYALIDLADEPASTLVTASIVRTLLVTSGVTPTPSGLVLAGD